MLTSPSDRDRGFRHGRDRYDGGDNDAVADDGQHQLAPLGLLEILRNPIAVFQNIRRA
jgi:hypothetical protein